MNRIASAIQTEPVACHAVILATFNMLAVFGVTHFTADQMASVNTLIAAIGMVVRNYVVPATKVGPAPFIPSDAA